MTTTYTDSVLDASHSGLKAALVEPFLVVGVSAFWLVTLPIAAVSVGAVKIWDSLASLAQKPSRTNPLILRRGAVKQGPSLAPRRTAAKQV